MVQTLKPLDIDTIELPDVDFEDARQMFSMPVKKYYPYIENYDAGKKASYALKDALPSWVIRLSEYWFFAGLKLSENRQAILFRDKEYVAREGSLDSVLQYIAPFIRSWEPSQEQKTAMVGLLLYRCLKEV